MRKNWQILSFLKSAILRESIATTRLQPTNQALRGTVTVYTNRNDSKQHHHFFLLWMLLRDKPDRIQRRNHIRGTACRSWFQVACLAYEKYGCISLFAQAHSDQINLTLQRPTPDGSAALASYQIAPSLSLNKWDPCFDYQDNQRSVALNCKDVEFEPHASSPPFYFFGL